MVMTWCCRTTGHVHQTHVIWQPHCKCIMDYQFVKKCLLNTRTTPKPIMIKDYLKSPRSLSIRSLHPTAVTLVIKKVTVMVMNDLLSSLSFNVNLPSNSWDSAFSKFDIENPWSRPRVCSKLFRNLPLEISKVKTKIKTDSYIWGLVFNQSIHFSFYLKIWPWKSEVKVKTKVKTDGYIWGLVFNRYVHFFLFHGNQTFFSGYSIFHIWPWICKVKVMAKVKLDGHIWGP